MTHREDFQEIAHSGGQITIRTHTQDGRRGVQLEWSNSNPTPASIVLVRTRLLDGEPQCIVPCGGIDLRERADREGSEDDNQAINLMLASDSEGYHGQECPQCHRYWRTEELSAIWPTTCTNCGVRGEGAHFLTMAQRRFLMECCDRIVEAIHESEDGEHIIDLDAIAKKIAAGQPKPDFYHSEERQQNDFRCSACNCRNDILGRYGYCSVCGTYNAFDCFQAQVNRIRRSLQADSLSDSLKGIISAYDGYFKAIIAQLCNRIPMTPGRQRVWRKRLGHGIDIYADDLLAHFDINLRKGVSNEEWSLVTRSVLRRHVYEHNSGQVDQDYIDKSGDASVRLGQLLRESQEELQRLCTVLLKIARTMSSVFHDIFPATELPIRIYTEQRARMKQSI